jgi:hypothetical protein
MFWNLFERIINAVKPGKESEQVIEPSQQWREGDTEQPEDSQQPSPGFQETTVQTQQNNWQKN